MFSPSRGFGAFCAIWGVVCAAPATFRIGEQRRRDNISAQSFTSGDSSRDFACMYGLPESCLSSRLCRNFSKNATPRGQGSAIVCTRHLFPILPTLPSAPQCDSQTHVQTSRAVKLTPVRAHCCEASVDRSQSPRLRPRRETVQLVYGVGPGSCLGTFDPKQKSRIPGMSHLTYRSDDAYTLLK